MRERPRLPIWVAHVQYNVDMYFKFKDSVMPFVASASDHGPQPIPVYLSPVRIAYRLLNQSTYALAICDSPRSRPLHVGSHIPRYVHRLAPTCGWSAPRCSALVSKLSLDTFSFFRDTEQVRSPRTPELVELQNVHTQTGDVDFMCISMKPTCRLLVGLPVLRCPLY